MPIYKITAPDGRTLQLTGESPPSEQELEQVFQTTGTAYPQPAPEMSGAEKAAGVEMGLGQLKQEAQRIVGSDMSEEEKKAELAKLGQIAQKGAQDIRLRGLTGMAESVLQGATFGFGEEVLGALGGPGITEKLRARQAEFEEVSPTLAFASEMAGGLPIAAIGAGAAQKGGSLLARGAKAVGTGAALGGAYGAGKAEGGIGERLQAAATPAMLGAGLGVVAPVAGVAARGLQKVGQKIAESPVGTTLGQALDGPIAGFERTLAGQSISGAPLRAAYKKQAAGLERELGMAGEAGVAGREAGSEAISKISGNTLKKLEGKTSAIYEKEVYPNIAGGRKAPAQTTNLQTTIAELSDEVLDNPLVNRMADKATKPMNIQQLNAIKGEVGDLVRREGGQGLNKNQVNRIYDAIREDFYSSVGQGAQAAGKNADEVVGALQNADLLYSSGKATGSAQKVLEKLANPKTQSSALTDVAKMAQKKSPNVKDLRTLQETLDPQDWNTVRGTVIQDMQMGAKEGQEVQQFIKSYDGMDDAAKEVIFGDSKKVIDQYINLYGKQIAKGGEGGSALETIAGILSGGSTLGGGLLASTLLRYSPKVMGKISSKAGGLLQPRGAGLATIGAAQ